MTEHDAVQIVWDYHHLNHTLRNADAIFVLGSHDTRVAEYAADLFLQGYAPRIIFSGGYGRLTSGNFSKPEAEVFAEVAMARGVPAEHILIENRATNTGENILFTKRLLEEVGLTITSFILVQKPYMERRAFATFSKQWPDKEFIVTSPPIGLEDYPNREIPLTEVIDIMVGDLQRIMIYPAKGFQIEQDVPPVVHEAYDTLVAAGHTSHLLET